MRFASIRPLLLTACVLLPQFVAAAPKECAQNLNEKQQAKREHVRALVCAVFAKGLDDEAGTIAYIGITQDMVTDLLQKGRIDLQNRSGKLKVHPTHNFTYSFAEMGAATDAKRLAAVNLIRTRRKAEGKSIAPEASGYLLEVLTLLMSAGVRNHDRNSYSVSYQELFSALLQVDIPFATKAVVHLRPGSQDYQTAAAHLKLHTLMSSLRYSSGDELNAEGELSRLFANLPMKAGYVAGIKNLASTSFLLAENISGLEPLGEREFSFMEMLAQKKE